MGIEKIGPAGESKPSSKGQRKSTPDTEEFQEMMKPDKVGETEFDKPKKRRYFTQEEEHFEFKKPKPKQKPSVKTPSFQPKDKYSDLEEEIPPSDQRQKATKKDKHHHKKNKKVKDKKKKDKLDEIII